MMTLAERFWSKVDQSGGPTACWPWTGARLLRGLPYGRFKTDGATRAAHRIAFRLANGELSDGVVVMHRCDNPPCCNPAHLTAGTHQDNSNDMSLKCRSTRGRRRPGTGPSGVRNAKAKLTSVDVDAIRRALREGVEQKAIAAEYGVSPTTISRIALDRRWLTKEAS